MIKELSLRASEDRLNGRCLYRLDDYSLIYECQPQEHVSDTFGFVKDRIEASVGIQSSASLLLLLDTLTLTFDKKFRNIVEIDAYTNHNYWENGEWESLPVTKEWRTLHLEDLEITDRKGISVIPRYKGSLTRGWVRIILDGMESSEYYNIGKDLILGVKGHEVKEIVFCNLQVL